MKNQYKIIFAIGLFTLSFGACTNDDGKADGYGNFEAATVMVSAESNGKLVAFQAKEGTLLNKGQFLGYIDTIPLSLKKKQLQVAKKVVHAKSTGVLSQITVLKSKLKTARLNKQRIENLIKDEAATQKQWDDISGNIDVLKHQIKNIEIQNAPVVNELKGLDVQLQQIQNQLDKCKITNPIDGTVLVTYAEENEITSFGRPLYKIADLSRMELRVYVSETQLSELKIGQEVFVKIDGKETMKSYKGKINWIASEAEFTPKIIQTKEERVALVYAVKIEVVNDGSLKIGMPAEMWLKNRE